MCNRPTYRDLRAQWRRARQRRRKADAAAAAAKALLASLDAKPAHLHPESQTQLDVVAARIVTDEQGIAVAKRESMEASLAADACRLRIQELKGWQRNLVRTPRRVTVRPMGV
jgi:hypothetical protein